MTITINDIEFTKVTELSALRETRRTDIRYNTQGDIRDSEILGAGGRGNGGVPHIGRAGSGGDCGERRHRVRRGKAYDAAEMR